MRCPSCGTATGDEARFCAHCGSPLQARDDAHGSDPGRPAHAGPVAMIGDRRIVTALFADLVDYVRMLAEHDPEEVRARVTVALATMAAAIERFEGTRTPTLNIGCELRNVSFSYGRGPVLSDVSLQIPAGRITTLVGESGSGKTTIADLLLGLYGPDNGTVTVDGVDLRDLDITQWRSMIGYVAQEIVLFNDTILQNVILGDQEVGEDRVRAALDAAGLRPLLAELPDGLETQIGERGFKLSGGQRQRIALARAMVHQPKLLILDEATSALDPATEAEICATVAAQAGRTTVLAITHQPSWVERADRIYMVVDGKVRAVDRATLQRPVRAAT